MANEKAIKELEQQIASLTKLAHEHGLDAKTELHVLEQKLERMSREQKQVDARQRTQRPDAAARRSGRVRAPAARSWWLGVAIEGYSNRSACTGSSRAACRDG